TSSRVVKALTFSTATPRTAPTPRLLTTTSSLAKTATTCCSVEQAMTTFTATAGTQTTTRSREKTTWTAVRATTGCTVERATTSSTVARRSEERRVGKECRSGGSAGE